MYIILPMSSSSFKEPKFNKPNNFTCALLLPCKKCVYHCLKKLHHFVMIDAYSYWWLSLAHCRIVVLQIFKFLIKKKKLWCVCLPSEDSLGGTLCSGYCYCDRKEDFSDFWVLGILIWCFVCKASYDKSQIFFFLLQKICSSIWAIAWLGSRVLRPVVQPNTTLYVRIVHCLSPCDLHMLALPCVTEVAHSRSTSNCVDSTIQILRTSFASQLCDWKNWQSCMTAK